MPQTQILTHFFIKLYIRTVSQLDIVFFWLNQVMQHTRLVTLNTNFKVRGLNPGPIDIKLFESENELKCKNRLRDFIETLCLFSNIWENYVRLFTISKYRYNHLAKFLLFSRKNYDKILENILKFDDSGPWSTPYINLEIRQTKTKTLLGNYLRNILFKRAFYLLIICWYDHMISHFPLSKDKYNNVDIQW